MANIGRMPDEWYCAKATQLLRTGRVEFEFSRDYELVGNGGPDAQRQAGAWVSVDFWIADPPFEVDPLEERKRHAENET